jgi:sec-independent protein translocase protein TatA
MPNIGLPEIIIVLVIALVIFGPKRLPELGRSLGNGKRELESSSSSAEPVEGEVVETRP